MKAKRLRPHAVDLTLVALIAAASLYFAHRGVQGGLGLRVGFVANQEEKRLSAELEALRMERARLETLTERLGDGALDLDLLDERARAILGRARTDEIVIR